MRWVCIGLDRVVVFGFSGVMIRIKVIDMLLHVIDMLLHAPLHFNMLDYINIFLVALILYLYTCIVLLVPELIFVLDRKDYQ